MLHGFIMLWICVAIELLLKYKRYMEIASDIDFWDHGEEMCCFLLISVVTETRLADTTGVVLPWAIAVRGQLQNTLLSYVIFVRCVTVLCPSVAEQSRSIRSYAQTDRQQFMVPQIWKRRCQTSHNYNSHTIASGYHITIIVLYLYVHRV